MLFLESISTAQIPEMKTLQLLGLVDIDRLCGTKSFYLLQMRFKEIGESFVLPVFDECMIKETGRTHHSTIAPNKPIKEGYKLFAIGNEGYLYNYSWYSPVQGLENRPKVKGLGETSAMVVKIATDTLPTNTILFTDNYFTTQELAVALKARRIAVCGTMKPNQGDLPELLLVGVKSHQIAEFSRLL